MLTTEQKLDPEFKAKWIAALRSGDYDQGRGFLNQDGLFCCLGVACEVFRLPKTQAGRLSRYCNNTVLAPEALSGPVNLSEDAAGVLMGMNDSGATFAEIADYIEANL